MRLVAYREHEGSMRGRNWRIDFCNGALSSHFPAPQAIVTMLEANSPMTNAKGEF